MKQSVCLAAMALAVGAIACSGPGTHDTMLGVLQAARIGAFASGLLSLFSIGLRFRIAAAVNVGFLVVHPMWTMSPYSGDCGSLEITAVLLIAILSVATFAWDLLRRQVKRDR